MHKSLNCTFIQNNFLVRATSSATYFWCYKFLFCLVIEKEHENEHITSVNKHPVILLSVPSTISASLMYLCFPVLRKSSYQTT